MSIHKVPDLGVFICGAIFAVFSCFAQIACADDRVVLVPVQNSELADSLADNFTLPLLLNLDAQFGGGLDTRIEAEARKLTLIMQRMGYLDAHVEISGSADLKYPLRLTPTPGQLYKLGLIEIANLPLNARENLSIVLDDITEGMTGQTATQVVLEKLNREVLFQLREASFGNAILESSGLVLDEETATAGVTVRVHAGLPLIFGETRIEASHQIGTLDAQALVPFRTGDPYQVSSVDALQNTLDETDMFRRVRIELVPDPVNAAIVHVAIQLQDKPRSADVLSKNRRTGWPVLVFTMFAIVISECFRVTSLWSNKILRRSSWIIVIIMIGLSGIIIFDRLNGFLL